MIKLLIALLAFVVASCAKEEPRPELVTVVQQCTLSDVPEECISDDPSWEPMPMRALNKDDPPRNYAKNREAYTGLVGKRRVCKAAIEQFTKEYPNGQSTVR